MKPNLGQGDKGKTEIFGGKGKIWKDDPRVEAYGTVDELNSLLGVIKAVNNRKDINGLLENIQKDLFTLQSQLAQAQDYSEAPKISPERIKFLEEVILRYEKGIPPLKNFILPGGGILGSLFHLARTITRRAERKVLSFSKKEALDPNLLAYLNRLGDVFFALARWANYQEKKKETIWRGRSDQDM